MASDIMFVILLLIWPHNYLIVLESASGFMCWIFEFIMTEVNSLIIILGRMESNEDVIVPDQGADTT